MTLSRRTAWQLLEGLLPGILVFILLTIDPVPASAAPWIAKAYSPLLLWALIRKIDADSRILGVPWRKHPIPFKVVDLAMQVALTAMTIGFAAWPR